MKILVTAFDPFGNDNINPSELAIKKLPNTINNAQIIKQILPTIFKDSSIILEDVIKNTQPNIIINVGQAGGSNKISIERVAINIDDARIEDNSGSKPIDTTIRLDGDNAYFSTLPIKAILKSLQENNISSEISNSAGTFVCNHIMYESLYLTKNSNTHSGFIHIPYIPEQTIDKPNVYSMKLDKIVEALIIIIKTAITYYDKDDIKLSFGKEF